MYCIQGFFWGGHGVCVQKYDTAPVSRVECSRIPSPQFNTTFFIMCRLENYLAFHRDFAKKKSPLPFVCLLQKTDASRTPELSVIWTKKIIYPHLLCDLPDCIAAFFHIPHPLRGQR